MSSFFYELTLQKDTVSVLKEVESVIVTIHSFITYYLDLNMYILV